MKRFTTILALMLFGYVAQAQFVLPLTVTSTVNNDEHIKHLILTDSTADTTYAVDIRKYNSCVKLAVQAHDTSNIQIYYRLSADDTTWSAWTLKDSAKVTTYAALTPKVVDLTSTASGCSFIQFAFIVPTWDSTIGLGNPTYSATLKVAQ